MSHKFFAAVAALFISTSMFAQNPDLGVQKGPRTDGDLLNSENVFQQADGSYVRLNLAEDGETIDLADVNNTAAVSAIGLDANGYYHWLAIRNKQTGQKVKKLIYWKRHSNWAIGARVGAEYCIDQFGPTFEAELAYEGVNNVLKFNPGVTVGEYVKTSTKAGDKYIAPTLKASWEYKVLKSKTGTLERFYLSLGIYGKVRWFRDINKIEEIAPLADGQEPRTDAVDGGNLTAGGKFTLSWLINKKSGARFQVTGEVGPDRRFEDFGHKIGIYGHIAVGFNIPLSRKTYTPKVGVAWAKAHGKTVYRTAEVDFTYGNRPYQQSSK